MTPQTDYALSIKQPWAALLVHGLKKIEVRRWGTARRGRILIHAARFPDQRPEGWNYVTDEIQDTSRQLGGIIGAAKLDDCVRYQNLDEFIKDQPDHLNQPAWYEETGLYGFVFCDLEILPFRPYPGWVRFFPVTSGPFRRQKKLPTTSRPEPGPALLAE